MVALENFADQSDRAIAEMCGVNHETVGAARRENKQLADSASSKPRKGKDGKLYPARKTKPDRSREGEDEDPPRT